jgi:hypothetical protein
VRRLSRGVAIPLGAASTTEVVAKMVKMVVNCIVLGVQKREKVGSGDEETEADDLSTCGAFQSAFIACEELNLGIRSR